MHDPHENDRRRVRSFAIALACTLTACATAPEPQRLPPRRPLGSELATVTAPEPSEAYTEADPVPEPAPEPTGHVRMQDSLAAALLRHPDLAAASWEVRAAEARTLQAGRPSNPELDIAAEEFGGRRERDNFDSAELSVGLSQEILLAGKLDKRTAVARLEGDLAGWEYEATRLDVLTETAKAFVDVLAAQERLALLDASVRIAEQVFEAVGEEVRAGKVSPMDENRARVEVALQRLARDRSARELAVKRRNLAAAWGSTSARYEDVEGPLYELRPVPAPDKVANLLSQNPDIARWAVEMELYRARLDLQRAGQTPDITLSAGVSHYRDDSSEAFSAGISIPLPVFDLNTGGVLEAVADRRRADEGMRAAAIRVRAALFEAYQNLAVSGQEAEILRDTILPSAEAAFSGAEEGFRRGKFGFLDVLDAQRTLFEVRQQLVDALAGYHTAVADVERLIGQSLSSIDNDGDSQDAQSVAPPQGEAK